MSDTIKILLIPDVHAPYHDKRAFACALAVARGWRPDVTVCLGDFADNARISRYRIDPRKMLSFKDEVVGARVCFEELDDAVTAGGCTTKEFLQGNHDLRMQNYVLDRAPDLIELPGVDWDDQLGIKELGWKFTAYKESIQYGKLRLTHDVGRAGINAARQSVVDMGASVGIGHTHRLQVHYIGQLDGDRHVGATFGWLGDPLAISYRHRDSVKRDSIHGLGVVHMLCDGSGLFWLQAVPIIKGQCVIDGVLYSATDRK
jgi:hypothetical protein